MDPVTKSKAISAKARRLADQKLADLSKLNQNAQFGTSYYDQETSQMKDSSQMDQEELDEAKSAADTIIDQVTEDVLDQQPYEQAPDPDNALVIRRPIPTHLTPPRLKLPKGVDELYNSILESLGSERDIKEALLSEGSDESIQFLRLLMDPNKTQVSITRKAQMAGVTLKRLRDLMVSFQMAKAQGRLISKLPEFAVSLHTDASTKRMECGRCDGLGFVVDKIFTEGSENPQMTQRICPRCFGSKVQTQPGDRDARKTIAETVGWTGKHTAPIVNVNIGGVESIIKEVDKMKTVDVKAEK